MEQIKCTIDHITYQNQENGYAVPQAIVKGYRDKQTLVGTFHEVKVGAVLTVDGDWRVDKRYGRQFAAQSWSEELPATIVGIEKPRQRTGQGHRPEVCQAHRLAFRSGDFRRDRERRRPAAGSSWHRQDPCRPDPRELGETEGCEGHHGLSPRPWCQLQLSCLIACHNLHFKRLKSIGKSFRKKVVPF